MPFQLVSVLQEKEYQLGTDLLEQIAVRTGTEGVVVDEGEWQVSRNNRISHRMGQPVHQFAALWTFHPFLQA